MKTVSIPASVRLALILFLGGAPLLPAQSPPGPPPGPPGDTMKSLQQLWDKIAALETQNAALQAQLGELTDFLGAPIPLEMVPVGNPGNAADQDFGSGAHGAVSYPYRIGKYEVTNAQWVEFLNAVAASDPNGLYNVMMAQNARGGITRSGPPGSFAYAAKPFMGEMPVNFVNWFSAARYCNWLGNGKPSGGQGANTTEAGAYTLTGPTTITLPGSDPTHGANGRNAGAKFFLPSENEWYKAAYHQPVADGGDTDDYWLYPTGSNSPPTVAAADGTGSIANDTDNIANYANGADWNGQDGNLTTVGSGAGSASYYGAFHMGGNAAEWTEATASPTERIVRGGSFEDPAAVLGASAGISTTFGNKYIIGFRVASL